MAQYLRHPVLIVMVGNQIGQVCVSPKSARQFVEETIKEYKKEHKGAVVKDEEGLTVIDYIDWQNNQRLLHITTKPWQIRADDPVAVAT